MKKITALLAAVFVVFCAGCRKNPAKKQQPVPKPASYRLAVAEAPGTEYRTGVALGRQLGHLFEGADTSIVETSGSLANMALMHRHRIELALVHQDVAEEVFAGRGPFQGSPFQSPRMLAAFALDPVYLFVPVMSPIQSIADLKGKRVAIGKAGSGSEVTVYHLLSAFHVNRQEIDLQYLSLSDQMKGLEDGTLDAAFVISGLPSAELNEYFSRFAVRPLSISGPSVEQLLSRVDFYEPMEIPANTYANQPQVCLTIGVRLLFLTNGETKKEDEEAICRTLMDHWNDLSQADPSLKHIDPLRLFPETGIPYSEGTKEIMNKNKRMK